MCDAIPNSQDFPMKQLLAVAALMFAVHCTPALSQDYIAVKVEAENFTQKNSLWRVFSASDQPNVSPDPDNSHHNSASGQAYLELLPDTRVTHDDPLRSGDNFWPSAGEGPSISYHVNFPESGRYTVWAKAYSTGTEDNGIHVGINDNYPGSGERMQWCQGKNNWTWSSAQRVNDNHCGTPRTIYLDVPFAGANTITFTAREDGFELDQFMFIKENESDLICEPDSNDNISCNRDANGSVSASNSEDTNNNTSDNSGTDSNPSNNQVAETTESAPSKEETQEETQGENGSPANRHPDCMRADSDPDGDGYGWENEQTCITSGSTDTATTNVGGFPVCIGTNVDSDGDGWGWENEQTCIVDGSPVMQSRTTTAADNTGEMPLCEAASSDPDGDGWGWENFRSCKVQ